MLELVITYAEAHNIQLVCLQETRWPDFVLYSLGGDSSGSMAEAMALDKTQGLRF